MSVSVIDLSHYNVIPQSLQNARDEGVLGLIHKATEGSTYVDEKLAARHHLAKDAGMLWGCYHFLNSKSSGEEQARHFVDTMDMQGVLNDDTLVACDHEDTDAALSLVRDFLLSLHERVGRMPVIYSGHVLKEQLADYVGEDIPIRLWLAQYSDNPEVPPGFDDYWLWQFADDGVVSGIDGPVDLNLYEGTEEQLRAEWAGRPGYLGA